MFEEFSRIYARDRRRRLLVWSGWVGGTLLLCWLSGGSPVQACQRFFHAVSRLSFSASAQAGVAWLALAWSLLCIRLWGGWLWGSLFLLRFHWRFHLLKMSFRGMQWRPTGPISFALSTSGAAGQMNMSSPLESAAAFPRLRLPQKPAPRTTRPMYPAEEDRAAAEVPTRPARHHPSPHPTGATAPLQVAVGWHPGLARRHAPNEDGIVTLQGLCTYQNLLVPFGLFVVADGMGGHEGGLEAARMATRGMMHTVLQTILMGSDLSDEYLMDVLIGGVEWANMAIYEQARKLGNEMGTTLTAALVLDMKAYIVNVGDSRTYLYRDEVGLTQITRDHSLVASLVTLGQITSEEMYTHPERNKIYRNLGQRETIKVDWFVVELCPRDRLLLCSDGLWEMVRDPSIARALCSSDDPAQVSDRLVQTALRGGGADNVSVVVVFVA